MKSRVRRVLPTNRFRRYLENLPMLALAIVLLLFPFFDQFFRLSGNNERVWFFNVGQGDSILIETPNHKQILIDGGPDDTVLQKLSSVMWPWDRTLDVVIISHPDADHITGLISVFDRYKVSNVYETGVRGGTPMIQAFDSAITNEKAKHTIVRAGDTFIFDKVEFDVLWPTNEVAISIERNNASVVLKVNYGVTSVLLTGDAEESAEKQFSKSVGDINVLKVGHHGSSTSTSVGLLKAITPETAVISVGKNNHYKHPHPIVLSRLKEIGAGTLRTDLYGDILASSDGKTIKTGPFFLPF